MVIEPRFLEAGAFNNGLALVQLDNNHQDFPDNCNRGFIDTAGEIVTDPYCDAREYSEGLAAIKTCGDSSVNSHDCKWGFVDNTGNIAIEAKYDFVRDFSEGVAVAAQGRDCPCNPFKISGTDSDQISKECVFGYVDKTGEVIIEGPFSNAWSFSEGIAAVEIDGKYGFIDRSGNTVIDPVFQTDERIIKNLNAYYLSEAAYFSQGVAAIEIDDRYGFIDKTGKIVISPQFTDALPFFEGLAAVETTAENATAGRWGFIDMAGKTVIDFKYSEVGSFANGIAPVAHCRKGWDSDRCEWGLIDRTGRIITKPQYADIDYQSEELWPVAVTDNSGAANKLYGFIDPSGNTIIEPQFNYAYNFSEGLAAVELNGKYGYCYIDKKGNVVVELENCIQANRFSEGLAAIRKYNSTGLFDKVFKAIYRLKRF